MSETMLVEPDPRAAQRLAPAPPSPDALPSGPLLSDALSPELARVMHRAALLGYAEARDALGEACRALARAAGRASAARSRLLEEEARLRALGRVPDPPPALLGDTPDGRAALGAARVGLLGAR